MPDESSGEKTEEPTQRRLDDMRRQGNVAKSKDLGAALVLLGSVLYFRAMGGYFRDYLMSFMTRIFMFDLDGLMPPEGKEIIPYALQWLQALAFILLPFMLGLFVLAYIVNVLQTGFVFAEEAIKLDLNKINPVSGLSNLFQLKKLMELVMNMAKLLVVGAVVYVTMRQRVPEAGALAHLDPRQILSHGAGAIIDMMLRLAIVLVILALLDLIYQRWQYIRDARMTKQEVKEENRSMEGDPQIKSRRRQVQLQLARQRMMQEVPEAEVVIRNPTHFAVAIRYKPEMEAPVVVAKGMDHIAKKIIDAAMRAGVPIWQDPLLARELYNKVEVGAPIPPELFQTLAEVLAHVLKGEKLAQYQNAFAGAA